MMLDRETRDNTSTENEIRLKQVQLEGISTLLEKVARVKIEESKIKHEKKYNFDIRGFCSKRSACRFSHPEEVCEKYEHS